MGMETEFHRELKRQTADFFQANGMEVYQEFRLPNNYIADVFGYREDAGFIIAEVHTALQAWKCEDAYRKYAPWCNKLYLATPETFEIPYGTAPQLKSILTKSEDVGLITVHTRRIEVTRPAVKRDLSDTFIRQLRDRIDIIHPDVQLAVPNASKR